MLDDPDKNSASLPQTTFFTLKAGFNIPLMVDNMRFLYGTIALVRIFLLNIKLSTFC